MKSYDCHNLRKNREIKNSDKYITLDILLKFVSLDKNRITSSEPKDNLVRSGKWLITSLGIKDKSRPKKYKKAIYSMKSFNMKDFSNIIMYFDQLS